MFLTVLTLVTPSLSCSRSGAAHAEIELGALHLKDVPAGQWLNLFLVDYGPGAPGLKRQVVDKLHRSGVLVDEYAHAENGNEIHTRVWSYEDYSFLEQDFRGGIWEGPEVSASQQYYQGELAIWITIEFPRGVQYSTLLPHTSLPARRDKEHAATVLSETDHARLFLFGYGHTCKRISLM